MKDSHLNRRRFLKGAAVAVAAPYVIPSSALGDDKTPPPSARVTLGHIGVGNRGGSMARFFPMHTKRTQSVAFADVYKDRREGYARLFKGKAYADFRDILARPDIDAVVVATPDHWHVPIAIAAARAKKDAYVEKPLGVSIEQDLACLRVFNENARIFQYGTMQRSFSQHCRFGCELVRSGRIGKLHTIEVIAPNGGEGGSTEVKPVPPNLDYDMWCGPAPVRPYTPDRCKPDGTYWIYDYSIGYLGGWGAHPLDIMVWGIDSDMAGPMTVEGAGMIPAHGLYDTVYNWDMKIQFADGVKMTFKPGRDSTKFIGTEGWVRVWRGGVNEKDTGIETEPKSLLTSKIGPNDVHLFNSPDHYENFVDAILSRKPAVAPLDHAVRSDVISLLCDIAVRTKRKITWDPNLKTIVGDADAAKLMHRDMREPWTI
jgi:glucose-fructose oxidoreductase